MKLSVSSCPPLWIAVIFGLLIVNPVICIAFTKQKNSNVEHKTPSFVHLPVLYGHVHMAKTAGSSIVGNLSMHFERVCGNKGYSYDAYQTNERMRANQLKTNSTNLPYEADDMVNRVFGGQHNRGKLPSSAMKEIGFEDCDYVSMEGRWTIWPELFAEWPFPVELHVSCRDPLDHYLSFLNFKGYDFQCNTRDKNGILRQVAEHDPQTSRFSMKLLEVKNFTVKCFDFRSTSKYMGYMGARLQRKRIETDYVFRSTNRPRDKTKECLWDYPDLQDMISDYLAQRNDYYKFCSQCLGSEDDLFFER